MYFNDSESLSIYLDLEHDGYRAYVMPVNDKTIDRAGQIREFHKIRLSNAGYEGYDDTIDNEYHAVGTYFFLLSQDNQIVLSSRINDRARSPRFPFEMGQRLSGGYYVYDDETPAVDINTYSVVPRHRKKGMPLLAASFGRYVVDQGAKKAFCLVDQANGAVQRIYSEIRFAYSNVFTESIVFPSFLESDTKKPVEWGIMEWDESTIQYYCQLHRQLSALLVLLLLLPVAGVH